MSFKIAIVGCGYVADYYVRSMMPRPGLQLVGCFDNQPDRAAAFAAHHRLRPFGSIDELVDDKGVDLIVNLTPPASHTQVNRRILMSGKHLYCEKPLALSLAELDEIRELARRMRVSVACAPCCVLGESAQTLRNALAHRRIGKPLLAYAQADDGLIHRMPHEKWVSESGAAWPYESERHLGCVLCHAPYPVSWLAMLFGPVRFVHAMSINTDEVATHGPNAGIASLEFANGMVARVTVTILANRDRSLVVWGDEGVLRVADCSDDRSPVRLRQYFSIRRRRVLSPIGMGLKLCRSRDARVSYRGAQRRDFGRGIDDMVESLRAGVSPRLSLEFVTHVTEVVLAMHAGECRRIESTFPPIQPMPWAVD